LSYLFGEVIQRKGGVRKGPGKISKNHRGHTSGKFRTFAHAGTYGKRNRRNCSPLWTGKRNWKECEKILGENIKEKKVLKKGTMKGERGTG